VEELDPEFALELPDLLAERRLRDLEALGGAAEMELLRDGDEVAQPPEVELW